MTLPTVITAAITALEQERQPIQARLDAIDLALSNLRAAFPSEKPAKEPRRLRAVVKRAGDRRGKATRSDSTIAASNERKASILAFLRRNGGVGTAKEIQAALPKEPGLTADQRVRAFGNTMQRLKASGQVGRTGDTWSLAGAGTERTAS